jgi:Skp family chaperone for outer membrane proteins
MKPMRICSLIVIAAMTSSGALSQTNPAPSSATPLPTAPGSSAATANEPVSVPLNLNAKVAGINIEAAVFLTNEGQRDLDALNKKFGPKSTELNNRKGEIDALKKQQMATGVTEERKAELQRQIDQKQKQLQRDLQDAQEDYNNQRSEIGQRILQKVQPVIGKYIQDNNLGMVIDTSAQWPNGPVIYSAPLDITKPIVDAYNVQSGVAAPSQPKAPAPLGSNRPSGASPGTSTPSATTPKQ